MLLKDLQLREISTPRMPFDDANVVLRSSYRLVLAADETLIKYDKRILDTLI